MPADLREWLELAEAGLTYEAVAETFGPRAAGLSRRQVKKATCVLLFGQPRSGSYRWDAFRRRWPTLAAWLGIIKGRDYRRVAWLGQRVESRFMIETIAAGLLEANPALPLLTLHDALLTPPEHVAAVRDAITETFAMAGLSPRVKIDV